MNKTHSKFFPCRETLRKLVLLVLLAAAIWCFYGIFQPPVASLPEQVIGRDDELERILERAAMADKTVILTLSNEVWAAPNSIADMFLDSLWKGNGTRKYLDNLVVVSLDRQAQVRCKVQHRHCYLLLDVNSTSREAAFMSPTYVDYMWKRMSFLLHVLELGYSFVSSDADILWLQDPFPHFSPGADMAISTDGFSGRSDDMGNYGNLGFYMTRSNERTIKFFKYFISCRNSYPHYKVQDVFHAIKRDANSTKIGVRMTFLDTVYFGGFCQPSKNFNLVCTMHANCCTGLHKKILDLRLVVEDWFTFHNLSPAQKANISSFKFRSPHYCRLP